MRKKFLKGIVGILFIGMFLVPVISSSVSVHGSTVAPMGMDPGLPMGGEPGPFMD